MRRNSELELPGKELYSEDTIRISQQKSTKPKTFERQERTSRVFFLQKFSSSLTKKLNVFSTCNVHTSFKVLSSDASVKEILDFNLPL